MTIVGGRNKMKELVKVIDTVYGNYTYDVIDTDEVDAEDAAALIAYEKLYVDLGYFHDMTEDEFEDAWDFDLYLLEDTEKSAYDLGLLLKELGVNKFLEEYGA